jgi:hypothetical protein
VALLDRCLRILDIRYVLLDVLVGFDPVFLIFFILKDVTRYLEFRFIVKVDFIFEELGHTGHPFCIFVDNEHVVVLYLPVETSYLEIEERRHNDLVALFINLIDQIWFLDEFLQLVYVYI